jgi:NAD(P)-dependent dehydrogenase (short-subunit alcohol dehydrogenase family)
MAQKLKGKSAVVTGSGSPIGIGRGVALALAEEGARVVVNDIGRDSDGNRAADKVAEEIKKAGGTAVASYDSVTTMQGGENIIKTAVSNFGGIDILVNCAGNFILRRIFEMTEKEWDSIIDVHLKGHFACCKAAVLEMIKQKSGRIINFSSRGATIGGGSAVYSAAKAGILGLTSALAADLMEFGITVNAILPSAVTELFPGVKKQMSDNLPVALNTEPDYVAPVVAYLATNEAQGITGRYIYASGGDICIYPRPLQFPYESPVFIRKMGKWTVDELSQVLPQLIGAA